MSVPPYFARDVLRILGTSHNGHGTVGVSIVFCLTRNASQLAVRNLAQQAGLPNLIRVLEIVLGILLPGGSK